MCPKNVPVNIRIFPFGSDDMFRAQTLTTAHSMLRNLCTQVNQVVRKSETTKLLQWCEERVKYDSQTMSVKQFQFDSITNAVGPRQVGGRFEFYKFEFPTFLSSLYTAVYCIRRSRDVC